jgi:alcohol dehydrogenase (cytochrome c)
VSRTIGILTALFASAAIHAAAAQVPFARIRDAARDRESWLTYSGSYDGHRFSSLDELTPANVAQLRPVWIHQLENTNTYAEATPLVADGVMYIAEPMSAVVALDLKTGRPLWRYARPMSKDLRFIGHLPVSRGVALLDSSVYLASVDAHLIALDARSGAVRWDVEVADNAVGHGITVAPLAIDGKVIVGVSGGEAGIRGFLDAYDARTGKRAWRFWTIPGPRAAGGGGGGGGGW